MDNSGLKIEMNENLADSDSDIKRVAIQQLTSDLNAIQLQSEPIIEMDGSSNEKKTSSSDIIQNANNKFFIDVLSPQVIESEKTKRIHKYILLALNEEYDQEKLKQSFQKVLLSA